MEHIVLLGDSIFDNKRYVGGAPDVVSHLRAIMPKDWTATLCAVDGSVAESVRAQCDCVPQEATQLVLSVGGNDALRNQDLLYQDLQGNRMLGILAEVAEEFEINYRNAVQVLRLLGSHSASAQSIMETSLQRYRGPQKRQWPYSTIGYIRLPMS